MNRRELIKAMGTLSLGVCSLSLSQVTFGAQNSGRYWVFVHAGGGWDVTNQWDPKGSDVNSGKGPVNNYRSSDIRKAGNIRYAPVPKHVDTDDMLHTFTQKHYRKMMVVNGIDQGTNSHSVGRRVATSGLQSAGVPVFPALVAAPYAASQSMAYIHQSGHSETAGLVAKSNILKKGDFERLTNTNRYIDSDSAIDGLIDKKRDFLSALMANESADNRLNAMKKLEDARTSSGSLNELLDMIPGELSNDSKYSAGEISAAAFKAGLATSASIGTGGFDTHSDNDQRQFSSLDTFLRTVDHLMEQLKIQGVADETTVVLCSDFGRKPYYDGGGSTEQAGKGHWPVTSMVFIGAGVSGNQVVGGTDDGLRPIKINPNTLRPDNNGVELTSASVHNALRGLAGLSGSALDERYPLNTGRVNLFD